MSVKLRPGECPVKAEYLIRPVNTYKEDAQEVASTNKNNEPTLGSLQEENNLSNVDLKENVSKVQGEVKDINGSVEIVNIAQADLPNVDSKENVESVEMKQVEVANVDLKENVKTEDAKSDSGEGKRSCTDEYVQPSKKKQKGQNKARPRTVPKQAKETRICLSILVNEECRFGEGCKFNHNVEEYLATRQADLGDVCVNFRETGKCRYGIECLFSKDHLTEDNKNIIDEEKFQKFLADRTKNNTLKRDVMVTVRKRKYKFSKSDKYLSEMHQQTKCVSTNETTDIREKRKVDFAGKLYLAPLTTLGNLPFRRICKRLGADITCGEMAMSTKLLQCQQAEWALIKRDPSEDIFGVQICGGYPDTMTKVTELLNAECHVDFIDINMGCPIDFVFKKGEGSALMGRLAKLEKIVRGMVQVSDVPVTIKMRTGIYENNINAHKVIPMVKEWGVDLITLHGRTREQRYTKDADWDYINSCAELANPVPLFGNGDIFSYEEMNEKNLKTSGAVIARGALVKPWIFTEIKEQRHWDISSSERFDILKEFTNAGLSHWGSDFKGVENTRRFLLEWLSFLCRYVPVGLLEVLPQKINERAPRYYGRNDLETLFSSDNAEDWVKISEMILGPVPDSFIFLPKHKANSYS